MAITPKFLLCVDRQKNELYILHRLYPACLIQVIQETPIRFVIQDLYDNVKDTNDILTMPFIKEAKDFFKELVTDGLDLN